MGISDQGRQYDITWGLPATGPTFHQEYQVEFRPSSIAGAGMGFWAVGDIPKGVRLRRCEESTGSLRVFRNLELLSASGWDLDDAVNYGIGHTKESRAICYLNPGTAMNHADSSRNKACEYRFMEPGVIEIWSVLDIAAGEEIFNDYEHDFMPVGWYDEFQNARGNTPLSQLAALIENAYRPASPVMDSTFSPEMSKDDTACHS